MSGESGASQFGLGQRTDPLGCHSASEPLQPSISGAASGKRYLLLEDDLDERLETRGALPQRRRAVALHDRREVRISARELGDALGERVGC